VTEAETGQGINTARPFIQPGSKTNRAREVFGRIIVGLYFLTLLKCLFDRGLYYCWVYIAM